MSDDFIDKKMEQFFKEFEVSNDRYTLALHVYPDVKKWLHNALQEALEEGSARRGGQESEQKQRMYEAGTVKGRKEGLQMTLDCLPVKKEENQDEMIVGIRRAAGNVGYNTALRDVRIVIENIMKVNKVIVV